jgi:hypothetical protein
MPRVQLGDDIDDHEFGTHWVATHHPTVAAGDRRRAFAALLDTRRIERSCAGWNNMCIAAASV